MYSAGTNPGTKDRLNTSGVGPRIGATKLAAAVIRGALTLAVFSALLLSAARPSQAQTETVLYNFCPSAQSSCADGASPSSRLTSDGKGNFYGTTTYTTYVPYSEGGNGTVFELSPNGEGSWNETVLYSFCQGGSPCTDGTYPYLSYLIFDSAGNLYGTAQAGGAFGNGVVFELSPAGGIWTETVLYSFANNGDGANPVNGLIMDPAGNLYGKTLNGNGEGVVFELSPSGGNWTERAIYVADGSYAGLTMDAAGNIFGVGMNQASTVFELSPNGNGGWNPTVIFTFVEAKDGIDPQGTLVLDDAGNLYGTTAGGGAKSYGTVYKLSPVTKGEKKGTWTEKILYSFKGEPKDGSDPIAEVVLDAAGNIYGTTSYGGKFGVEGIVFELVAPVDKGSYKEKVLLSFDNGDGNLPYGSLILDSADNLYGVTYEGGPAGIGLVFEVTPQ